MMLLLTFVCLLAGVWSNFREQAINDVTEAAGGWTPQVIAPYVLRTSKTDNISVKETHHLWLFGAVIDLPFVREFPEPTPFMLTVQPTIILDFEEEIELVKLNAP